MRRAILIISVVWMIAGCAATGPYVASGKHDVQIKSSARHDFAYVRIQDSGADNELMIYGKLFHPHEGCRQDAQVVLRSTDGKGKVVYTQNMTMRPQSNHQKGWSGAGFRDRVAAEKVSYAHLTLSIVDVPCRL